MSDPHGEGKKSPRPCARGMASGEAVLPSHGFLNVNPECILLQYPNVDVNYRLSRFLESGKKNTLLRTHPQVGSPWVIPLGKGLKDTFPWARGTVVVLKGKALAEIEPAPPNGDMTTGS